MLRHELKPPIAVNDTLPVPRMDQIVIALLQQTGETLESALQGFGTRWPGADRTVGPGPAPGLSGWHAAHIHSDVS